MFILCVDMSIKVSFSRVSYFDNGIIARHDVFLSTAVFKLDIMINLCLTFLHLLMFLSWKALWDSEFLSRIILNIFQDFLVFLFSKWQYCSNTVFQQACRFSFCNIAEIIWLYAIVIKQVRRMIRDQEIVGLNPASDCSIVLSQGVNATCFILLIFFW